MLDILIVDDSPAMRELLCSFLSEYGTCETAENGQVAVELFRERFDQGRPFRLVIMDMVMPVMDGATALQRIQDILENGGNIAEGETRFIMLSCVDDPEHMVRMQFESNVEKYVTKPCDLNVLHEALVNMGLLENPAEEVLDAFDLEEYS